MLDTNKKLLVRAFGICELTFESIATDNGLYGGISVVDAKTNVLFVFLFISYRWASRNVAL